MTDQQMDSAVERVNNGNIASEALALETVQCRFQSFFSKKENVLLVVFSKMQYPEKRKCSGGCIFDRNGLEDWPKGEVTHERKLSRAH